MIDTFIQKDSVIVKEGKDTVLVEKWRTTIKISYKDRIDTVMKTDTVPAIIEVEKKLTQSEQLKLSSWWILLVGAGVGAVMLVLKIRNIFTIYKLKN